MVQRKSAKQARRGAERVVQQLRSASHKAFLVGGCVRDRLLGRSPRGYDIATSATPDEVIALFKRTVPIGAEFGVVMVLVPEGEYEVATFRAEASYSDGRRPDSVTFVSAKEDVLRRDFTINGLLEDPVSGTIEDFVGGRADLDAGVIRAIGDPTERFAEDHLRILRAIRFAATLGFDIEVGTFTALTKAASTVTTVSGERVRGELTRMFAEGSPSRAYTLLSVTKVRHALLPESVDRPDAIGLRTVQSFKCADLPTILAVLLGPVGTDTSETVAARLKLSNTEKNALLYVLKTRPEFGRERTHAETVRFIRHEQWIQCAELVRAETLATDNDPHAIDTLIALHKSLRPEDLNPPPLLTGNDLKAMGLTPGPLFKQILTDLETEQLEGRITTREQAEAFAKSV